MANGQSNSDQISFSLADFCARHKISKSLYFKLKGQGRGPAEMRLGPLMIRITVDAERAWLSAMSNSTGEDAEAQARAQEMARARGRKAGRAGVQSPDHVSKWPPLRRSKMRRARALENA